MGFSEEVHMLNPVFQSELIFKKDWDYWVKYWEYVMNNLRLYIYIEIKTFLYKWRNSVFIQC